MRLTLPPGSVLPPEATGELDWFGVAAGQLGPTLNGAKLPVGWKGGVEREVAALERLPRLVPGTEVTLRNIGDVPLVVLRLTVLPVDQVSSESGQAAAAPANLAHGVAVASAAERVAFGRRRPRRPGDRGGGGRWVGLSQGELGRRGRRRRVTDVADGARRRGTVSCTAQSR